METLRSNFSPRSTKAFYVVQASLFTSSCQKANDLPILKDIFLFLSFLSFFLSVCRLSFFLSGSQDDPLVFPIIRPHRTTCLYTDNLRETKHGFQVTGLPQSAYRLSQGGLWSWPLFRMSVHGGEHPGKQCQKWQLHLQIWLPRQQMPERYNLMINFLSSLITMFSLCSAPYDH